MSLGTTVNNGNLDTSFAMVLNTQNCTFINTFNEYNINNKLLNKISDKYKLYAGVDITV